MKPVFLALAILLAWPSGGHAQNGRVAGVVIDRESQSPLAAVALVFKHTENGKETTGRTDDDGRYRIASLRFGSYEIRASLKGYRDFVGVFQVEPRSNDQTTINIEMRPEAAVPPPTEPPAAPKSP